MQKLTEYVKIAEAARILGCSQTTLQAWADAGHVPAYRNPANGYRIAQVHNGSSLFSGDAGQGESNIRREMLRHATAHRGEDE